MKHAGHNLLQASATVEAAADTADTDPANTGQGKTQDTAEVDSGTPAA